MLKSIRLQNFFSFNDETIELNPGVNILVGINGSGKSNLLKAIQLLREVLSGSDIKSLIGSWGGFDSIIFARNDVITNYLTGISITYEIFSSTASRSKLIYTINITRDLNVSINYGISEEIVFADEDGRRASLSTLLGEVQLYTIDKNKVEVNENDYDIQFNNSLLLNFPWKHREKMFLRSITKAIELYEVFDTSRNSNIRKPVFATAEERLSKDGSNLSLVMNYLKGERLSSYNLLSEKLRDINPNFIGFDYMFFGGNVELSLQEKGLNRPIKINHISDGTLRYICLQSVFCNPERGEIICIDEPETGLHPDMILNISKSIKDAGQNSQFIISTHSSQLLNHFELSDILVFDKDENNATTAKRYSEEDFKGWYETFYPGQMWLSGDLGGTRW